MRSLPDPTTDRWTSHLSFSVSGLAGDIPSTPTLETSCAGCAAQAVQSVVWVNISELASTNFSQVGGQQELTDLLGGLLLNSSGNVTGSLRPVTSELPTLGLSRQVMGALANVALPNDGGYPAPPANVQAPPKEEQWWQVPGTVLWNAVSGVVGLVSVAWDATAAAAEYLANAAGVLLTDLGITALVDQAVAALKTVASAMETALQALLAFVEKEVTALFNTALQPFYQARNAFAQSVLNALDPTGPEAVWDALSGSLFLLGITVAAVIQVAIGRLTAVTFGAGSILTSIVVGLVLSLAVTAILYVLPALISPGTAMVNSCQSFSQSFLSQPSQAGNWTTWADTFGFWQVGTSNVVAFQALREAWAGEGSVFDFVTQTAAFAFGLLVDAFAFYANYLYGTHDTPDAITTTNNAIIVGAVSVILEVPSLIHSEDKTLDGVILGMDALAWGISAAELESGY